MSLFDTVSNTGLEGPSMWKLSARPPSVPSIRNLHSSPTRPPVRPGPEGLMMSGSIKLFRRDIFECSSVSLRAFSLVELVFFRTISRIDLYQSFLWRRKEFPSRLARCPRSHFLAQLARERVQVGSLITRARVCSLSLSLLPPRTRHKRDELI